MRATSAILDGFCDLFLGVASLLCLVVGFLWLVSQQGAAADRAGSGVIFAFACAVRWLCVSFVLIRIASQGAFTANKQGSHGWPLLGLLVMYAALELLSAVLTAVGNDLSGPKPLVFLTLLTPAAMPAPLIAYAYWWIHSRGADVVTAGPWRWWAVGSTGGLLVFCMAIAGLAAGIDTLAERSPARVAARLAARLHEIDEVVQAGSMVKILEFTVPAGLPQVRTHAMAAIAARPNHQAELFEILKEEHIVDYQTVHQKAMAGAVRYLSTVRSPPAEFAALYRLF